MGQIEPLFVSGSGVFGGEGGSIPDGTVDNFDLNKNTDYGVFTGTWTFGGTVDMTAATVVLGTARFSDGTAAAPSITFSADLDTGIYRKNVNNLAIVAGGQNVLTCSTTWVNALKVLYFTDGTVALPGLCPASDSDTGIYSAGPNDLGITVAGAEALRLNTNVDFTLRVRAPDGTLALPGLGFVSDPNTGLFHSAADTIQLVLGGAIAAQYDPTTNIVGAGIQFQIQSGTVGAPGLGFAVDTDTGWYSTALDQMMLALGGVQEVVFTATTTTLNNDIVADNAPAERAMDVYLRDYFVDAAATGSVTITAEWDGTENRPTLRFLATAVGPQTAVVYIPVRTPWWFKAWPNTADDFSIDAKITVDAGTLGNDTLTIDILDIDGITPLDDTTITLQALTTSRATYDCAVNGGVMTKGADWYIKITVVLGDNTDEVSLYTPVPLASAA